jgi:hypothetical protein
MGGAMQLRKSSDSEFGDARRRFEARAAESKEDTMRDPAQEVELGPMRAHDCMRRTAHVEDAASLAARLTVELEAERHHVEQLEQAQREAADEIEVMRLRAGVLADEGIELLRRLRGEATYAGVRGRRRWRRRRRHPANAGFPWIASAELEAMRRVVEHLQGELDAERRQAATLHSVDGDEQATAGGDAEPRRRWFGGPGRTARRERVAVDRDPQV